MGKTLMSETSQVLAPTRRMSIGAEVLADGRIHFRVWAPRRSSVSIHLFDKLVPLDSFESSERLELDFEPGGWFSAFAPTGAGPYYAFQLDNDRRLYPDPASRFQPDGPHGLSQIIDPSEFEWTDSNWKGVRLLGQVVYEMHIGTFTPEGTFAAAERQLAELADVGITLLEVMPVADFSGRFGWGYDGVNLFAPTRLYGEPDDLRRFVDAAHRHGIGVILDVVYNHLGPDGNYLTCFSDDYFSKKYKTDWGEAINFDGPNNAPVRDFYLSNAAYWIEEFHLDGLRLDATQDIHDDSREHILAAISRRARQAAAGREIVLIGENEPQNTQLVRPVETGGYGLDALWNDDFHHSAMVAITGRSEAYYTDYRGKPQEFISAMKYGYLYQGQYYSWQENRRGTSSRGVPPQAFVHFLQNHDQVANSARGLRCYCLGSPGVYRALAAVTLLGPSTPMLLQGQEFASTSPFLFFADHTPELARKVHEGRQEFMSQFRSIAQPEMQNDLAVPHDPETFQRVKLDFSERETNAPLYAMHRDLLRLRREDPVFRTQGSFGFDGAVLGDEAFVVRFFGPHDDGHEDRLLVVNLGRDLHLNPAPEPLLAPPANRIWETLWSTEEPRYGGCGTAPLDTDQNWRIPGQAAVVLRPAQPIQQ